MSRHEAPIDCAVAAKLAGRRRVFRGATLAIASCVAVCLQAGCLVPQSIDPKVASPHPPPTFVVTDIPAHLLTPILTLYRQGTADVSPPCHCQLLLSGLKVEESDPTISLEVRWFVDYDPTVPSSTVIRQRYVIDGTFDDPTATVRTLRDFAVDADALLITSSGVHVVDVVVAEPTAFDDSSATLPFRAMHEGYTPAVYRFAIDVHLEQASGQCSQIPPSQSPPSVRVCP